VKFVAKKATFAAKRPVVAEAAPSSSNDLQGSKPDHSGLYYPPSSNTLWTPTPSGPSAVDQLSMVSTQYTASRGGGGGSTRTPPPDLPSLLLNARIVYLGMPLVPAVTELIIAQLLYLQYHEPEKPVIMYINSTGSNRGDGEIVGFETEAFAIADTMAYIKPQVQTICVGQAYGMAAMLLASGAKGYRAALPHATIMLNQPKTAAQGQASEIAIKAREAMANRQLMLEILAEKTGQPIDKITTDSSRSFYMTPDDAKAYGLIDKVLLPSQLPVPVPAGRM